MFAISDLTACAKTPCLNAGTCTNDPKSPGTNRTCKCILKYTGTNCESRLISKTIT